MMKAMGALILLGIASGAIAQARYVPGYTRKDGTYVAPHYRSAPNRSRYDNWSSQPNRNPFTGQAGSVEPYRYKGKAPKGYKSSFLPKPRKPRKKSSGLSGY